MMPIDRTILLFDPDCALVASLQFALELQGHRVVKGFAAGNPPVDCLIVDQGFDGDGLAWLARLRRDGHSAPAILLATNPGRALRVQAAAAGAVLVEKPLLDDALVEAIEALLNIDKAA